MLIFFIQGVQIKLVNWEEGNYQLTDQPNAPEAKLSLVVIMSLMGEFLKFSFTFTKFLKALNEIFQHYFSKAHFDLTENR